MWRTAVIPPERLRHGVDAEGTHRIELVLRSNEVKSTPEPSAPPSAMFGRSAWTSPDGGEENK
jgi:hypothetical protein